MAERVIKCATCIVSLPDDEALDVDTSMLSFDVTVPSLGDDTNTDQGHGVDAGD